jgi:hypothetical protein
VIGDGGGVGRGVVAGQVAGGVEVVAEGPDNTAGAAGGGDLLVGQDLVNGGAPQVAMEGGGPKGDILLFAGGQKGTFYFSSKVQCPLLLSRDCAL